MAMKQKPRGPPVPRVHSNIVFPVAKEIPAGKMLEHLIVHPSPQNVVELSNGVLSKRYEYVGVDSGRKSGKFVIMRFSADAGFSMLESGDGNRIRSLEGTGLRWFREDVKRAAGDDAGIRAFVASHPKMGIAL